MLDLDRIRAYMQEEAIDVWLVYDFRGSNPVMWQLLGEEAWTTRRSFLFIPSEGEPKLLAHALDRDQFSEDDTLLESYKTYHEMEEWLRENLSGLSRTAMEYLPGGALPTMSLVDAGTLELIRSFDVEVVSSADLFQLASAWTDAAFNSHLKASLEVADIKDGAFTHIEEMLRVEKSVTEYDVQKFIVNEFKKRKLETEHRPMVAVNENSGNPHYVPSAESHSCIDPGDWVLIDLWARFPGQQSVFVDITWVGYVGEKVPSAHQKIFEIVKSAQRLVIERLKEAWQQGEQLQGWELDDVARDHIRQAGYEQYFLHRTGHSMGPGPTLQALGVNLDNFETHDTRSILPAIGFSVEPGIYMKEFGVRLEVNVYVHPKEGPIVTTPIQEEIIRLA